MLYLEQTVKHSLIKVNTNKTLFLQISETLLVSEPHFSCTRNMPFQEGWPLVTE